MLIAEDFPRPQTQIPVPGPDGSPKYFLDMGWEDLMLAVEYDGEQHADQLGYDIVRSEYIAGIGWTGVRVAAGHRKPASRWMRVASIAAALILAAFLGVQMDRREPVTRVARVTPAPAAPTVTLEAGVESSLPARGLELISSPGEADVVDFALGETQVVMIFDRELDI